MGKILVASLGFDERHVVRNLLRIGFRELSKIVLILPSWDADNRTMRAINEIKKIANIAGINEESIVLYKVNVVDVYSAIGELYRLFLELASNDDKIYVSLGGGLRSLVLEIYTAIIMLDMDCRRNIMVIVDLETGDDYIEFPVAIDFSRKFSSFEEAIIRKLLEGEKSFKQLLDETGIPRTTLWRILTRLVNEYIVIRSGNKYVLSDAGKILAAKILPQ